MATPVVEHDAAKEVNLASRHDDHAIASDVGIGEIDSERRVIVADARTEEQRALTGQSYLELRQESRPVVIDALLASRRTLNISMLIEDGEGFTVLDRAERCFAPARFGDDFVLRCDRRSIRTHVGSGKCAPATA